MSELDSLGLGPSVLQRRHPGHGLAHFEEQEQIPALTVDPDGSKTCTIVYEIALNSSVLEPRLRLSSCPYPADVGHTHSTAQPIYHVDLLIPEQSLSRIMRALPHPPMMLAEEMLLRDNSYALVLLWSQVQLTAVVQ